MNTYLIKLSELTLKGDNREEFELQLRKNIQSALKGHGAQLMRRKGRFVLTCPEEHAAFVEDSLDHVLGIHSWALARVCDKTVEAVFAACVQETAELVSSGKRTFKVAARRTDKSFPLGSYDIMREAGAYLLEAFPSLSVDVHAPEFTVEVEIREKAFVYAREHSCHRGLPVGTSGRGMLLLSGGIDSPVAGFLMGCRGMRLDAVYFHAYPYTSAEAKDKVTQLATIVGRYTMGIRLFTINFTQVQLHIKQNAPDAWTTILMRMAMMDIADRLARRYKDRCLVTGESLGQVASQTLENIRCSESRAKLLVLRPLIGTDKLDTIAIARRIGTYDTSILPYEDCCVLFSPRHPVIRADFDEAERLFEALALKPLLDEAFRGRAMERCGFPAWETP